MSVEGRNECPRCDGRGENVGYGCGPGVHLRRIVTRCLACDGTGMVSDARLDEIEAGREAREQRVHVRQPYQTMKQRAAVLGITEQQLSAWENYGVRWPGMPPHTTYPLSETPR